MNFVGLFVNGYLHCGRLCRVLLNLGWKFEQNSDMSFNFTSAFSDSHQIWIGNIWKFLLKAFSITNIHGDFKVIENVTILIAASLIPLAVYLLAI